MAIGVVFNFPGTTSDQYDEAWKGLNGGKPLTDLSEWPGILSHVAGSTAQGLMVVDVWESMDHFDRFGEAMVP